MLQEIQKEFLLFCPSHLPKAADTNGGQLNTPRGRQRDAVLIACACATMPKLITLGPYLPLAASSTAGGQGSLVCSPCLHPGTTSIAPFLPRGGSTSGGLPPARASLWCPDVLSTSTGSGPKLPGGITAQRDTGLFLDAPCRPRRSL